ncbi:CBO0543 family protein [Ammoniphilus sp. 3BR4]|uniref:CBO0543 family protein n=1 Tax=Ammoniphilus sp. 3BR4 TaxID=3158265 RepID=UPI00346527AD
MRYEYWIQHDLFTFQWWMLLTLFITPWVIWWSVLDKQRILEILLYGVSLAHFVFILDAIGKELTLWGYPYNLEPLMNRFLPIDTSALPVIYMLTYQYFSRWKAFLWVHILLACMFTFVLEPILVWSDIYKMNKWKHIYSFPIYFTLPVIMKWFIEKIKFQTVQSK